MARPLVVLALLLVPGALVAQGSAGISARATVSTTALTAGNIQDLDFGAVVPGTPTTIAPQTSAGAGHFRVSGAPNAEVEVTFALPAELAMGPNTIPLGFGPNSACQAWNPALRASCAFLDPGVPLIRRIPSFAEPFNSIHIWLGGVVTPAAGQQPGTYTGFVTLSVAYTGN